MAVIQYPIKTFHPQEFKAHPIPDAQITPRDVVDTLRHILRVSRQYLRHFLVYAFIAPATGQAVTVTNVRHYYELIALFNIVIKYINKRHPGQDFTNKVMKYRKVYYKWKPKFKKFYVSPYARFNKLWKDFINIIGLPVCYLRIVNKERGVWTFPGEVVRMRADGVYCDGTGKKLSDNPFATVSTVANGQDMRHHPRSITDEWACRLFGLGIPMYNTTLDFFWKKDDEDSSSGEEDGSDEDEEHEDDFDTQVPTSLLVEKECVFDPMFLDDFHVTNKCVLVTSSGFASEQTRAFCKYITQYFSTNMQTDDFKIQCLTDLGQSGASIIQALSWQSMPLIPHLHFNIEVGWIGLNTRFLKNAFPNKRYVSTSSRRSDDIIDNTLLDTAKGFVTSNSRSE